MHLTRIIVALALAAACQAYATKIRAISTDQEYIDDLKLALRRRLDMPRMKLLNAPIIDVEFKITEKGIISEAKIVSPPYVRPELRDLVVGAVQSLSPYRSFPRPATTFAPQETWRVSLDFRK